MNRMTIKRVPEYRHPSGLIFREVWMLSEGGRVVLISSRLDEVTAALEAAI